MRRGIAIVLAGLIVTALAAAPFALAKAKKVSGTLAVSVPGFDQTSHLSTTTGAVLAKKGCNANRIIHFAIFNSDGTPAPVGQPVVVSGPTGSFIAPIAQPPRPQAVDPHVAYTIIIRSAVDGVTIKKKGKKISCLPITGPDSPVTIPGEPQN